MKVIFASGYAADVIAQRGDPGAGHGVPAEAADARRRSPRKVREVLDAVPLQRAG